MTTDIGAAHLRINAANGGKWFALDFEGYLAALYRWVLRPGMVAVDCGANHGAHTLQMAAAVRPGGLVVAIEPLADQLAHLRRRIWENKLPESLIRLQQCGVSSRPGQAEFYQVDDAAQHGLSGLRRREYASGIQVKQLMIEVKTLDAVCAQLPRLDFLKLDIEGAEFDALRGGTGTLRRFRPVMTIEQTQSDPQYFGYTWADLLDFLGEMEYGLYDFFGLEYTRPEELQDCLVWDFAAIPLAYGQRDALFAAVREFMVASGVKGLSADGVDDQIRVEGCLVRRPGNSVEDRKVYFVEKGRKRWVTTGEWITARGMNWPADVRIIPAGDLDAMEEGPPLP